MSTSVIQCHVLGHNYCARIRDDRFSNVNCKTKFEQIIIEDVRSSHTINDITVLMAIWNSKGGTKTGNDFDKIPLISILNKDQPTLSHWVSNAIHLQPTYVMSKHTKGVILPEDASNTDTSKDFINYVVAYEGMTTVTQLREMQNANDRNHIRSYLTNICGKSPTLKRDTRAAIAGIQQMVFSQSHNMLSSHEITATLEAIVDFRQIATPEERLAVLHELMDCYTKSMRRPTTIQNQITQWITIWKTHIATKKARIAQQNITSSTILRTLHVSEKEIMQQLGQSLFTDRYVYDTQGYIAKGMKTRGHQDIINSGANAHGLSNDIIGRNLDRFGHFFRNRVNALQSTTRNSDATPIYNFFTDITSRTNRILLADHAKIIAFLNELYENKETLFGTAHEEYFAIRRKYRS